jgi:hypothetical protein
VCGRGERASSRNKHHEERGLMAYMVLAKAYTSISLVTEKIDRSHEGESSSEALNGQLEGTGRAALWMTLRKRASKSISHRHGIPASLIMTLAWEVVSAMVTQNWQSRIGTTLPWTMPMSWI